MWRRRCSLISNAVVSESTPQTHDVLVPGVASSMQRQYQRHGLRINAADLWRMLACVASSPQPQYQRQSIRINVTDSCVLVLGVAASKERQCQRHSLIIIAADSWLMLACVASSMQPQYIKRHSLRVNATDSWRNGGVCGVVDVTSVATPQSNNPRHRLMTCWWRVLRRRFGVSINATVLESTPQICGVCWLVWRRRCSLPINATVLYYTQQSRGVLVACVA